MLKRIFDLVAALVGLAVLSPLLVAVACWVKLDSPGPVFYRGLRAGKGNRPFGIYKFRSMIPLAESHGGSSTSDGDSRITRAGRFIRKYKLDELCQLLNVLRGEMSIVGPRPEILRYTSRYSGQFLAILSVRPGITDWASIWNADEGAVLAGSSDPDQTYETYIQPTKLRLQLRYVHQHSLWIDLKIIVSTLRRMADPTYYPAELADVDRLVPYGCRPAVASDSTSPVQVRLDANQ